MFEAWNAQMLALPEWVGLWMNWMMLVFLASVLFVKKHSAARWVLGAFCLTIPLGFLVFSIHPSVHLLGVAHFILWLPLLVFLLKREIRVPAFSLKTGYGVWLCLLSATIVVSLLFDVRDIALVILGTK